jgi:DNA-binding Lrp family transcriptional regulator
VGGAPEAEEGAPRSEAGGDTGSGGGEATADPDGWTPDERVFDLERRGLVAGYVPVLDHDRFEVRTVIVRLSVPSAAVEAVVETYRERVTDAFELTGAGNLLLVLRFVDATELTRFLATVSTDDRITSVTVDRVVRTACEHDALPLVEPGSD